MSNPMDPRPLLTSLPNKREEVVGEFIPKAHVVKMKMGVACGYCGAPLVPPESEIPSGRELKCPGCKEFMWIEVKEKEDKSVDVMMHPGRRPRP